MLLNFNYDYPLYVIGTGVSTDELIDFIQEETIGPVYRIAKEDFFKLEDGAQCMLGFHNIEYRINLLREIKCLDRRWPTYIHPSATTFNSNQFGMGTVIGPQTYVGYGAKLGDFCALGPLINIGHGSELGTNCVVSPGAIIAGSTVIGDNVYIGLSSTIRDKISVCSNVTLHMTSVVTKPITEPGIYVGNRRTTIDNSK